MDIKELRDQIDIVDEQLLALFLKRMEISGDVARYKEEHGLPILNKGREREILRDVEQKSPDDLEVFTHRYFSNMMELSRAYQNQIRQKPTKLIQNIQESCLPADVYFPKTGTIAVSGVEGAYAQEAADTLFSRGDVIFKKNFAECFEAVESGECEFGFVPIENSSYGSVRDVYELFRKHDVSIIRSVKKNIQHELLAKPGTKLSEIKEIYSHEQAIGQCGKFIKSLGSDVVVHTMTNTAMAAKMVAQSDRTDVAAIASHDAGALYGLRNIKSHIMDSANNYTRFVCFQKKMAIYAGSRKISLILATEHRPGALYDVLSQLSAMDINVSKLESCPIVGHDFEFYFFVDLDASVFEPGILNTLAYLERTCASFKYLGNYLES